MRIIERLRGLKRPFFTVADIVEMTELLPASARRWLIRKVESGELIRVRRNLYVLSDTWVAYERLDHFRLANVVQTPSYVSYLSALAHYEMTTQIPISIVESANPVRSSSYEVQNWTYRYYYCRHPYYSDYIKSQGVFIATPEKALIDSVYLMSLGRYELDREALDLRSINWKSVNKILRAYPPRFINYGRSYLEKNL